MAKKLDILLKDIPEEQREDFLNDPANRAAVAAEGGMTVDSGALTVDEVSKEKNGEGDVSAPDERGEKSVGEVAIASAGTIEATEQTGKSEGNTPEQGGYQPSTDTTYRESPAVAAAREALAKLTEPTPYSSAWQERLAAAAEKILNRDAFSYDPSSDPVYAAYSAEYRKAGRTAMEDALGRATAYTGGYSNSYAASAANAAYQNYIAKLSDKLPELYAEALKRYDSETEAMYDEFDLYRKLENDDYSRYKAELERYENDRDYLAKQLKNESDSDYKIYSAGLDSRYKAEQLKQKADAEREELRFKAEQAEADRALALEKLEKELEYKASSDLLKYGTAVSGGEDAADVSENIDGSEAASDGNGEMKLTLNGIKSEFYSLLTSQGSGKAFLYIDGLVSSGKLSIQAARNVLSECGVLDAYLAKKRGENVESEGSASRGATAQKYKNLLN